MNTSKMKQEIQNAEEALARMKKELEEAEQMNSKDFYPESHEIPFNVDKILKAIDNKEDDYRLYTAFDWQETPQGLSYWDDRSDGGIPLSDEDKITLLRWCVNYYRSNNK